MLKAVPLAVIAMIAGLATASAEDVPANPATNGLVTVPPAKVLEPGMVQTTNPPPATDPMATNTTTPGTMDSTKAKPNAVNPNPATGNTNVNAVDAPLKGANSFTESQARSRIESNGFSGVTGLAKDSDGIWRGKAMKDGRSIDVALDYKGEIVAH